MISISCSAPEEGAPDPWGPFSVIHITDGYHGINFPASMFRFRSLPRAFSSIFPLPSLTLSTGFKRFAKEGE